LSQKYISILDTTGRGVLNEKTREKKKKKNTALALIATKNT